MLIKTVSNGDATKLFSASSIAVTNKSLIESAPNRSCNAGHPETHKRGHRRAHCIVHQEASRILARLPNPSRVALEESYWPLKRLKS